MKKKETGSTVLVKYKHRHVNNDSLMSEACYQTLHTEITEKQVNKTQTKTHGMWCFMHHYIHKCCATLGISNSKQVLMKAFFYFNVAVPPSLHISHTPLDHSSIFFNSLPLYHTRELYSTRTAYVR